MTPTKLEKKKGYQIRNKQLTFIFDESLYAKQLSDISIEQVGIQGSFSYWKEIWPLTKVQSKLWKLEVEKEKIKVPGNSGQPEFRFIINGQHPLDAQHDLPLKYKFYDGHHDGYKNTILFTADKADKIKKINHRFTSYKTNYNSQQELANFRPVPVGQAKANTLYRSYHPFIPSKPDHPREKERLQTVQQLIKHNNINSIVNLSDTGPEIPQLLPKYQQIIDDNKNIIFVNQHHNYDIYYYSTHNQEFTQLLQKIAFFILNHQPPFLIHCRIGTDRTGVISAILAALCGVNWSTIIADYKKSNKTGIKEYRDEKLLKYTFSQLLEGPCKPQTLNQKITSYFQQEVNLTAQEIKNLTAKLKNTTN